jgi:hypothetical protein
MLFAFLSFNALSVFSLTLNENSEYLNERFTGNGHMSASQALGKILPTEVTILNIDANLEKMITWKIKDQKRSSILNELANQLHFFWQKIDYRILISSTAFDSPSKKISRQPTIDLPLTALPPTSKKSDPGSNRLQTQDGNNELETLAKVPLDITVHDVRRADQRGEKPSKTEMPKFSETQSSLAIAMSKEKKLDGMQSNSPADRLKSQSIQLVEDGYQGEDKMLQTNAHRFEVTKDDETLSIALKRWSTQEGYQLVWDAAKDFPAIQTVYESSNIENVILKVMKDIENTDYPLHACIYKNKVLRIVPTTKVCERQKGVSFE